MLAVSVQADLIVREIDKGSEVEMSNLDRILKSKLSSSPSKMHVLFRKVVRTADYETETVELSSDIELDSEVSEIERAVIFNLLTASTEYTLLSHLYVKGTLSKEDFVSGRDGLEKSSEAILRKYEAVTGESRDKILGRLSDGGEEASE